MNHYSFISDECNTSVYAIKNYKQDRLEFPY